MKASTAAKLIAQKLESDRQLGVTFAAFVSLLVERKRNLRADTSLDYLERKLNVNRESTRRLAKLLQEVEVGVFRRGRRGWESRIIWSGAGAYELLEVLTMNNIMDSCHD